LSSVESSVHLGARQALTGAFEFVLEKCCDLAEGAGVDIALFEPRALECAGFVRGASARRGWRP
jgi:hypothetical protein